MEPARIEIAVLGALLVLAYIGLGRLGRRWYFWRRTHDTILPLLLGLWSFAALLLGGLSPGFP